MPGCDPWDWDIPYDLCISLLQNQYSQHIVASLNGTGYDWLLTYLNPWPENYIFIN